MSEYFPSPADPVKGIWVARQVQALVELGVDVRVLALRRALPPLAVMRRSQGPSSPRLRQWTSDARATARLSELDGTEIANAWFVSPPRPISYGSWSYWMAPVVRRALAKLHRAQPFDLLHAHYAAPTGHAVAGWCKRAGLPLVLSVHGGDVFDVPNRSRVGRHAASRALSSAQAVLCNSQMTLTHALELGAQKRKLTVVHLGADRLTADVAKHEPPTLVTVANLDRRKRHEDVLQALALIADRLPGLRYRVIGEGPERQHLEALADRLGLSDRVDLLGQLSRDDTLREIARCHLFVMPSVDEAFGVAYVEAMAAGLVAIGCQGEGGPEEIAASGDGMVLVGANNPQAMADRIFALCSDRARLAKLGARAKKTASEHFSWSRCADETLAIYQSALERR